MEPDKRSTPPRRFLTPADVAQMLQLDEAAIEVLVESGELPAIRMGEDLVWRIEETVLDGYLEAKYEESRRSALWAGHDFASIAEVDPASGPRRAAWPRLPAGRSLPAGARRPPREADDAG